MFAGLSGSLLSHDGLEALADSGSDLPLSAPPDIVRRLRSWYSALRDRLGPSCTPRAVFDMAAEPLFGALGYRVVPTGGDGDTVDALLQVDGVPVVPLVVTPWGQPAGGVWRHAVHRGLAHGTRWCLCSNGSTVAVFDVDRAYARRGAEFSLDAAMDSDRTLGVIWAVFSAQAMRPPRGPAALDRIVALCEQHRARVRQSLRAGVHDALLLVTAGFRRAVSTRHQDGSLLDTSLTVIYRILFLLFAEARGLVPAWHPVYRDGYTIESLRRELHGHAAREGAWEALQAIARLAHRGCHAGSLRVPPFNGRLFSPASAPLADSTPLDDRTINQALAVLTTRSGERGLESISYADLGVEQLGSVYEHLLDYDLGPGTDRARIALVPTGRRKATGSFYTPRSLTEFLVRRTLAPLVRDATAEQVLALRVLDPAMGSGAFLVAACRYLANAYEQALIRDGALDAADIGEDDRSTFRRLVAQRCLFGVDINPMAVQLGRLSLWLATLAADKPLSFLDHHLRAGNSLVGTSIEELARRPGPPVQRRPLADLPLFGIDALQGAMESALVVRRPLTELPDDTMEQVRQKERLLASLQQPGGALDRWKAAADLWCAAWYPQTREAGGATFRALFDRIVHGSAALPDHVAGPLLARARELAGAGRFFHWPLEFPEVFHDERGVARPDAGFDAIVGNPPWEMVREDAAGSRARQFHAFTRHSRVYALQGGGHANLYLLFLERFVRLLKPGGRAGVIVPGGLASDHGGAALRRYLFTQTTIDTFSTLDNRQSVFPIHRGVRFLLLTFTKAGSTTELPSRVAGGDTGSVDRVPDTGIDTRAICIPRTLLERVGGDGLAVPEIRTATDLDIVSSVSRRFAPLADASGWSVHFGRELNATDDRPHFREGGPGLPVLEGKQLTAFAVDVDAARYRISPGAAARLVDPARTYQRVRLGYREVASATNRMTLIAALVPRGVLTMHTVFCLKEPIAPADQQFLCGVFNSYVANYFVRMQVVTHVTAAVMARLPVPKPAAGDPLRRAITALGQALADDCSPERLARLNALVAVLYGLPARHYARVLETFPLVGRAERQRSEDLFTVEAGRWLSSRPGRQPPE